jgi:hypothetical protein
MFLVWTAAAWAQPSYSLKGITLEDAPGEFTVIFWSDPPIDAYHYSFPRNPARLAIDFPGKWKNPDKTVYHLENDTVKRIMVTRHPDRLRATLHLKTQQIFEPFIYDSIKGLIITIKKAHLFTKALPEGVAVVMAEGGDDEKERPGAVSRKAGETKIGASPGPATGELVALSMTEQPNGFRLTVSLDRENRGYDTFTLQDERPPKLVLDLKGRWRNPGETVREVESDAVRQVRVGEHPDYLRVVMDLTFEGVPTVDAGVEGNTVFLDVAKSPPPVNDN